MRNPPNPCRVPATEPHTGKETTAHLWKATRISPAMHVAVVIPVRMLPESLPRVSHSSLFEGLQEKFLPELGTKKSSASTEDSLAVAFSKNLLNTVKLLTYHIFFACRKHMEKYGTLCNNYPGHYDMHSYVLIVPLTSCFLPLIFP